MEAVLFSVMLVIVIVNLFIPMFLRPKHIVIVIVDHLIQGLLIPTQIFLRPKSIIIIIVNLVIQMQSFLRPKLIVIVTVIVDLLILVYNLHKEVDGDIMCLQAELERMKVALEKISQTPADKLSEYDKFWARSARKLSYDIEDKINTLFMVRCKAGSNWKISKIAIDIGVIKRRVKEHEWWCWFNKWFKVNNNHSVDKPVQVDPRALFRYEEVTNLVGIDGLRNEFRDVFIEFTASVVDHGLVRQVGEGTYGSVHEANIRGTIVAVKFLKQDSLKADCDLKNEIETFKTIRHENLVSLVGTCIEKRALIYEFCSNGTLADRLFPDSDSSSSDSEDWIHPHPLSWEERFRIAGSICSGLKFLHAELIVHRDLKPSNILFDAQDVCKICDFGLARLLNFPSDASTPFHDTDPMGTPYYIDPEFLCSRKGKGKAKLTRKSDVYSLGIILLQLVTGRYAYELRCWVVSKKYEAQNEAADTEMKCKKLVDPAILDDLKATSKQEDALKMIELGLECSKGTRKERPDVATVCLEIESMVKRY